MNDWRKPARWLWPAGLVVLVGLHFWFPPVNARQPNDTFGVGEEGKKAFYLLVREEADAVSRNLASLAEFAREAPDVTLCVLGASREPTDEEWRLLLDWVAGGGSLVYAFPYEVFDRPLAAGEERLDEIVVPRLGTTLVPADVHVELLGDGTRESAAIRTPLVEDASRLVWQSGAALVGPAGTQALLTIDDAVQAVRTPHGAGTVVLVASDEPFTNYQLAVGDGGVLGFRLLETAGMRSRVVFDESLNDSATPKLVGILLEPEVRPLVLQIAIVVYVFCWWGRERFGPVLPERLPPRQDVVAHSDAIGTLVHRAGDGRGALRAYYRQLIADLGLGKGSGLRADRALAPIARRLNVEVARVRDVLRDAQRACREERLSRHEAARHIRRLARIRQAAHARA